MDKDENGLESKRFMGLLIPNQDRFTAISLCCRNRSDADDYFRIRLLKCGIVEGIQGRHQFCLVGTDDCEIQGFSVHSQK
jgi:hypothetical protein